MVANMKVGTMDVFCVGEPWNAQLVNQNIGYTAVNTGEIWTSIRRRPSPCAPTGWISTRGGEGAADGRDGGAAVVRQDGEPAGAVRDRRPPRLFNVPVADIQPRVMGDYN